MWTIFVSYVLYPMSIIADKIFCSTMINTLFLLVSFGIFSFETNTVFAPGVLNEDAHLIIIYT